MYSISDRHFADSLLLLTLHRPIPSCSQVNKSRTKQSRGLGTTPSAQTDVTHGRLTVVIQCSPPQESTSSSIESLTGLTGISSLTGIRYKSEAAVFHVSSALSGRKTPLNLKNGPLRISVHLIIIFELRLALRLASIGSPSCLSRSPSHPIRFRRV